VDFLVIQRLLILSYITNCWSTEKVGKCVCCTIWNFLETRRWCHLYYGKGRAFLALPTGFSDGFKLRFASSSLRFSIFCIFNYLLVAFHRRCLQQAVLRSIKHGFVHFVLLPMRTDYDLLRFSPCVVLSYGTGEAAKMEMSLGLKRTLVLAMRKAWPQWTAWLEGRKKTR
jgi:hypothetical protein